MYKTKFFVLAAGLAVLILCALQINDTARAFAPQPLVTFVYQRSGTTDPGTVWFDKTGMHIRDRVDFGYLTGGIQGSARIVYNADLDYGVWARLGEPGPLPMPDDGVAFGTIEFLNGPSGSSVPSWEGSWSYELRDGMVVSGELTAANLNGWQMLEVFSVTEGLSGITHWGYIDMSDCKVAPCDPWPKE
jgi:hypothetical protein